MNGDGLLGFKLDSSQPSRVGAQILSLCYLFDKSIASNIEHKETLENTLSLLQAVKMGQLYAPELLKILLCNVSLYPKQTKVKIFIHGREEYAIVIDDHKERIKELFEIYDRTSLPGIYAEICKTYSRPVVRIVGYDVEEDIDLSTINDNTVTITSVVGDTVNYSELKENRISNKQRI